MKVLLVGKMGLKSVQVRAGTGMKIVDGTLQRAASTSAASSRTGTAGSPSSGTGKGESELTVPSPEFDRTRPVLYRAAWESMVAASGFLVDESGDVAPTFVQVIVRCVRTNTHMLYLMVDECWNVQDGSPWDYSLCSV